MTDDGSEFTITVPSGPMVCGYCGEEEAWRDFSRVPESVRQGFGRLAPHLALGYLSLTGDWSLAVGPDGDLVVVAFATTLSGDEVPLPHHCPNIPDGARAKYATEIAKITKERESG